MKTTYEHQPSSEPVRSAPIGLPQRAKFRFSKLFWTGLVLLVLGSGPLLTVIAMAALGLTRDPNPNPIGFGILAFLTFWPSIVLVIIGAIQSYARYKAAQG